MKFKPTVAVLLAAYQGEKFIEDQIKSIINQENVNYDLFINIDKSNDNTFAISENFVKKFENIKLLTSNNIYGSASKNFLNMLLMVNIDNYDYISFSDQDDIWLKTKLYSGINKIKSSEYSAYSSNAITFKKNSNTRKLLLKSQKQTKYDFLFEGGGPGCTYILKKDLAIRLQKNIQKNFNMIDNIWSHDWYIYYFARLHSYNWFIDKNSYILYRQHDNNQLGANLGFKNFFYRTKFVLSGKALNCSKINLELCGHSDNLKYKYLLTKTKKSYLNMIINFYSCRRKLIDKFLFLITSIVLLILK